MTYDSCAYDQMLTQSVAPLSYVLDPIRFENCSKCRNELGLVGGTAVSHISGNLVDLENDLRGQTRPNTHCPGFKYIPRSDEIVQGHEYIKPVTHPEVSTSMRHLPACQIVDYGAVPHAPPMDLYTCPQQHQQSQHDSHQAW